MIILDNTPLLTWVLDNTPLLTWEVQRCINRLKSVIFSADICILQTRTYWKVGTP